MRPKLLHLTYKGQGVFTTREKVPIRKGQTLRIRPAGDIVVLDQRGRMDRLVRLHDGMAHERRMRSVPTLQMQRPVQALLRGTRRRIETN